MLDWKLVNMLEDKADDLLQPHGPKVRKEKRAKLEAEIAEWIKDWRIGFPRLRAELERWAETEYNHRYSDIRAAEILTYIWTNVLPTDISTTRWDARNRQINTDVYKLAHELADKFYRG